MIKRLFKSIIALLLYLFVAAPSPASASPAWVGQRPHLPDAYVGIGMAEKKKGSDDYRQRARSDALFDLSQEISVAVSGTFIENIVEKTGLTAEEVRSQIRISSQARISGHELVDEWEDRNTYWVYYRLSRQRYHEALERGRAAALRAAADMWQRATAAGDNHQIVSALRFDYQALQQLADYMGDPLEIERDGRPLPLVNAIYAHLQRLLAAVRLVPRQNPLPVLVGQAIPGTLSVAVTYSPEGGDPKAIAQLPVRFAFPWRPGQPAEIRNTDPGGIAHCGVGIAASVDNGMGVRVAVDVETLFPDPGVILAALLDRLGRPQTTIRLQTHSDRDAYLWHNEFQDRRVIILSAYQADGQAELWPKYADEIMQLLKRLGAQVVVPSPSNWPAEQIMAFEPQHPWPEKALADIDTLILVTARGRLNHRENAKNPFGEDIQFAGEFQAVVRKQGAVTFSDRYRAMSGWNPLGARMCMEVTALNAFKRWKIRYLHHLQNH
jgi:DNA-binding transcriptional ArsR family regulator